MGLRQFLDHVHAVGLTLGIVVFIATDTVHLHRHLLDIAQHPALQTSPTHHPRYRV